MVYVNCPQCDGEVEAFVVSEVDYAGRLVPWVDELLYGGCECDHDTEWEAMMVERAKRAAEEGTGSGED